MILTTEASSCLQMRKGLRPRCAPHCCRGMGQPQRACRARPCQSCAPSRLIECLNADDTRCVRGLQLRLTGLQMPEMRLPPTDGAKGDRSARSALSRRRLGLVGVHIVGDDLGARCSTLPSLIMDVARGITIMPVYGVPRGGPDSTTPYVWFPGSGQDGVQATNVRTVGCVHTRANYTADQHHM